MEKVVRESGNGSYSCHVAVSDSFTAQREGIAFSGQLLAGGGSFPVERFLHCLFLH